MAANSGAYYEGLQYASQGVEPVKFGEIAMGFAKIVEDKRLEEKRDREKKEDFQMEMTKLFGEEIYSAFDGTGLADTDIVNSKIKDSIIARANVINSLYENGKLTNAQMMQEMVKLNAQSSKYASFAGSISDKVKEFNKLGGDASEYSRLMLDRLDELMKDATPVMDSSGNLSFLSKDGDVINKNPFNELQSLLDVRKRYDTESIINSVVAARGQEQIIRGGQVIKKPRDIGEADEKAFLNVVNSLDDADMFDIAQRAGVEVKRDPNSVFKITNREEVKSGLVNYMKESSQAKINSLESVDEVAATEINSKLQRDYMAAKKFADDQQKSIVNLVGEKDEDQEMQVFPKQGESVLVKSLIVDNKALPNASIGKYVVDKNGVHKATVSYNTVIDVPSDVGLEVIKKEVLVTEDITLKDPGAINQIRTQFGLDPIKQASNTSKPKAYE